MHRIYHEITRGAGTENEHDLEAYIEYSSRCTCKASGPTFYDPGWGAEWEHTITGIGFVVSARQTNPPAMTEAECVECVAYFEAHKADADEAAEEDSADDYYARADYLYDQWRDARMAELGEEA